MISRYHGLDLDIDLVASKAGYKEGDVETPIQTACSDL